MTSISLEVPIVGQKNTTEEPKVGNSITTIQSFINGANLDGTTNIKAEGITEANLAAAVVTKLNQKAAGLEVKKQSGSETGQSGISYLMETNAATLTLTATATAGKQVGITCLNGVASVKLKAGAGAKLFADYLTAAGVSEITVKENEHSIWQADGTNWRLVAGTPGAAIRANPATAPYFLTWGAISAAGAIEGGSGDITAAKTAEGKYEIGFTKTKTSEIYAVTATAFAGAETLKVQVTERLTTKFAVTITNNKFPEPEAKSSQWMFQVLATS